MPEVLARYAAKPHKIFTSSRLDLDIVECLASGPNVEIQATDNEEGIAMFVKAEIASRPPWQQQLPDQLQAEVVQTLCEGSNGLYV